MSPRPPEINTEIENTTESQRLLDMTREEFLKLNAEQREELMNAVSNEMYEQNIDAPSGKGTFRGSVLSKLDEARAWIRSRSP